jgi:hypothetical protein
MGRFQGQGAAGLSGFHLQWSHRFNPCLSMIGASSPPPPFIARSPPSIGMIAPVIQSATSDASSTDRPMSSGWPKRPAGMPCERLSAVAGARTV